MRSITLYRVELLVKLSENSSNQNQNSSAGRPTMCRTCGSIVGGGQKVCAVCGTSVEGSPAGRAQQARPDGETMRFARTVLNRPYKATIVLLAANLFFFLLMWQSSGLTSAALWEFPHQVLLAYGGKLNSLINQQHQWWRFVTPMFLHATLPHLLINMYSLWVVGPYVEKLYGSAKFTVFWVLTGIAGVVASYLTVRPNAPVGPVARFLFKPYDMISVGASGAIFGLVGVLFVFGIKFRRELPEGFKRAFGTGLLPIIVINLVIGYLGRGFIDNAAHLGGLVSGAALAFAVGYRRPGERSGVATMWRVLQLAMVALLIVSFVKTAQHFKDPPQPTVLDMRARLAQDQPQPFLSYVKALNEGQETFYRIFKDGDLSNADNAVKVLTDAPQLDAKSDQLKEELKAMVIEAQRLNSTGSANLQQEQKELTSKFVAWSKEYNLWLKTSGRNFSGLVELSETPSPQNDQ